MSGSHNMAPSGHDTHLYDPEAHDNQIVALYNTDAEAQAARDKLVASGVDGSAVQVMARDADRMAGGVNYDKGDQGLWGSIKSLFMPDDEAHAYNHAVDKGHAMVVVTPARTANRNQIVDVLESTDPIDFDAKLEEWRQGGYDYGNENKSLRTETATGLATGTGTAMGTVTEAASTAGRSGAEASTMNTGMNTAVAASDSTVPTTGTTGAIATGAMASADTIKVMEERLRVGKREVAQGGVRVRSYVVERPVEEQVRLHEERIEVERRPVDRAATSADAAFTDRTLEASATSEEAVIKKEARVIEEIELHKDVAERTETVKGTVRKTEVEVEDTTGAKTTTGTTHGAPLTTGPDATGTGATSSTAGATTSGMNAPRKP